MNSLPQIGDCVNNRYRILEVLGQGGMGTTYKAEDVLRGELVALKMLSIRYLKHTKVVELFEREARILSQLDHPGIPQYVDYFQSQQSRHRRFYIAQQLAEGQSLAALVEQGWKPDEPEVRLIATQLLEILVYLQQLTPPVLHRDIKPQNIIRSTTGQLFLVDFGAVQTIYHQTQTGGSTLIGTYGYMPPEQYARQSTLATDLYGLGKTLIFLLTQTHPANLPENKSISDSHLIPQISYSFASWIECLVKPVTTDRFSDAREALAILRGERHPNYHHPQKQRRLLCSPIKLLSNQDLLSIQIPSAILRPKSISFFLVIIGIAVIIFITFIIFISIGLHLALTSSLIYQQVVELPWIIRGLTPWIVYLTSFWLLVLTFIVCKFLYLSSSKIRFYITSDSFSLRRYLLNIPWQEAQGEALELYRAELKKVNCLFFQLPITVCVLRGKSTDYRFGFLLNEAEKSWLIDEINQFLFKARTRNHSSSTESQNSNSEETKNNFKKFPILNNSKVIHTPKYTEFEKGEPPEGVMKLFKGYIRFRLTSKLIIWIILSLITSIILINSYMPLFENIMLEAITKTVYEAPTKEPYDAKSSIMQYADKFKQYEAAMLQDKKFILTYTSAFLINSILPLYEILTMLITLLIFKVSKRKG